MNELSQNANENIKSNESETENKTKGNIFYNRKSTKSQKDDERKKKFNKKNQEDKPIITQNKYEININIYNIRLSNHT